MATEATTTHCIQWRKLSCTSNTDTANHVMKTLKVATRYVQACAPQPLFSAVKAVLRDDDDDDDDTRRSSLSAGATKLVTLARKTSQLPKEPHLENDFPLPELLSRPLPLWRFSAGAVSTEAFGLALCGTRKRQTGPDVLACGTTCSVLSTAVHCSEGVPTGLSSLARRGFGHLP